MASHRYAIVFIFGVLMAVGHTYAQETLRFSDLAGATTLVYPAGPNVTVSNPQRLANVEVWVIRDLDGAVVRTYSVTGEPIWKQAVSVSPEGRDEVLETLVQGQNVPLRFVLFLVGPDREVHEIYRFAVRRNAPHSAPTSPSAEWRVPGKTYAYLASGKIEAINGDEVVVRPWQGSDAFKVASNTTTNVSELSGKFGAWTWPQAKGNLKTGDQIAVLYTEVEGKKIAREWVFAGAVPVAMAAHPPAAIDPLARLRFQVGTVTSVHEDAAALGKSPDLIIDTRGGARRWRIGNNTRIMRGAVEGGRSDLSPKTLIAAGASKLAGSEVRADYVLLLKDLTGTATR
jgi:hypothetical protein